MRYIHQHPHSVHLTYHTLCRQHNTITFAPHGASCHIKHGLYELYNIYIYIVVEGLCSLDSVGSEQDLTRPKSVRPSVVVVSVELCALNNASIINYYT